MFKNKRLEPINNATRLFTDTADYIQKKLKTCKSKQEVVLYLTSLRDFINSTINTSKIYLKDFK